MSDLEKEVYKENLIKLVKHHKKHCDGPECDISVYQIRIVAQLAGIEFTDEEKKIFI
jgi:hypothetical protein